MTPAATRMAGALALVAPLVAGLVPAVQARAGVVTLEAGRDATLIEDPDGALANGSGPNLFAGRNAQAQNSVRRALIWFDVAAVLPDDAVIESVALTLYVNPSNPAPAVLSLHRVLADWGEGPSSASGGGGAPAEPGDVTWLHTFYDTDFWPRPGGHFVPQASAAQTVAGDGFYTWSDTPGLVRDVRLWLRAPQRNFGWLLAGNETAPQTAKSLASRDHSDPALRPVLEITYSRRPGPTGSRSPTR